MIFLGAPATAVESSSLAILNGAIHVQSVMKLNCEKAGPDAACRNLTRKETAFSLNLAAFKRL
jgi:hypothetical protein